MPRFFNLNKTLMALAVLGVLSLAHGTARADAITVVGNANPHLQANINIISLTNGSITFTVSNILVAGVTSTITGIGFELPGTITANVLGACAGSCGNFGATPTVSNDPGNVPQFGSAELDWAVITGPAFTGGNPPGINQGQSATFTVTGNFTGLTQAQFLAGVYVRFQSVTDTDPAFANVGSDVAHEPVPEPASMLLLGTGLLGVAAGVRRRFGKK